MISNDIQIQNETTPNFPDKKTGFVLMDGKNLSGLVLDNKLSLRKKQISNVLNKRRSCGNNVEERDLKGVPELLINELDSFEERFGIINQFLLGDFEALEGMLYDKKAVVAFAVGKLLGYSYDENDLIYDGNNIKVLKNITACLINLLTKSTSKSMLIDIIKTLVNFTYYKKDISLLLKNSGIFGLMSEVAKLNDYLINCLFMEVVDNVIEDSEEKISYFYGKDSFNFLLISLFNSIHFSLLSQQAPKNDCKFFVERFEAILSHIKKDNLEVKMLSFLYPIWIKIMLRINSLFIEGERERIYVEFAAKICETFNVVINDLNEDEEIKPQEEDMADLFQSEDFCVSIFQVIKLISINKIQIVGDVQVILLIEYLNLLTVILYRKNTKLVGLIISNNFISCINLLLDKITSSSTEFSLFPRKDSFPTTKKLLSKILFFLSNFCETKEIVAHVFKETTVFNMLFSFVEKSGDFTFENEDIANNFYYFLANSFFNAENSIKKELIDQSYFWFCTKLKFILNKGKSASKAVKIYAEILVVFINFLRSSAHLGTLKNLTDFLVGNNIDSMLNNFINAFGDDVEGCKISVQLMNECGRLGNV